MITINKNKLNEGDIDSLLQLIYFISPDKFFSAFKKIGVKISEQKDVEALSEIIKKKLDVNGQLINDEGNNIFFDALDIIKKIKFSKDEINKALTINLI